MSVLRQPTETTSRGNLARLLIGCAVMFTILQTGVTRLAEIVGQTWAAIIVTVVMLFVVVIFEKLFFKCSISQAFISLGFGLPSPRAILATLIIAVLLFAAIGGAVSFVSMIIAIPIAGIR